MSYMQDIEFEFEVGDQYDVTPLEGSYIIGKILALGGECYMDGNTVVVSSIPGKTAPLPAPAPVEKAVEPPPVPDPEPTPAPKASPEPKPEPPKPIVTPKASAVPSETPIKRARKTPPTPDSIKE